MRVGLVAAPHPAGVGLVGGVYVHVLLSVAGVGEPPITARYFTLEWFLTWGTRSVSTRASHRTRGAEVKQLAV